MVGIDGHKEKAAGRFALLFLEVTNRGLSPDTFLSDSLFNIQDADGNWFFERSMASINAKYQYNTDLTGIIDPDETVHTVAAFDISTQSDYYLLIPSNRVISTATSVMLDVP